MIHNSNLLPLIIAIELNNMNNTKKWRSGVGDIYYLRFVSVITYMVHNSNLLPLIIAIELNNMNNTKKWRFTLVKVFIT